MGTSKSIVNFGKIGRDANNIVNEGPTVSNQQWNELSRFAAKNGTADEYDKVRKVEDLVKDGKTEEAGAIWSRIRWFFDTAVARAANVAQIAEAVHDFMKKAGVV